jgi:hypothetical protein
MNLERDIEKSIFQSKDYHQRWPKMLPVLSWNIPKRNKNETERGEIIG